MNSLIVVNYGELGKALKAIPRSIEDIICLTDRAMPGYTCLSSGGSLEEVINMGLRLSTGDRIGVIDSRVCNTRVIEGLFGSMERYDGLMSLGHITGFGLVHKFGAHVIDRDCFYGIGYLDSVLAEDAWTDFALRTYLLGFMPKMMSFDIAKTKDLGIIESWKSKWPDWSEADLRENERLMANRHIIIEHYAERELYVPFAKENY